MSKEIKLYLKSSVIHYQHLLIQPDINLADPLLHLNRIVLSLLSLYREQRNGVSPPLVQKEEKNTIMKCKNKQ